MEAAMTNGIRFQGATDVKVAHGPTLIGETTDEIAHAAKRVCTAVNALREFNDGVHGPQSRAEGGQFNKLATQAPDVPTRANRLRGEVRSLHSALADLESEIARLNSI